MASQIIQSIDVPAGGGVQTIDVTQLPLPDIIILYSSVSPLVMSGNYTLQFSATPPIGTKIEIYWNFDDIDTGITFFQIFGQSLQTSTSQNPLRVKGAGFVYTVDSNGLITKSNITPLPSGTFSTYLNGLLLMDGTVPLTAIEQIASGNIVVGNGSNIAESVAMSGDVTISASGVTTIGAGKVHNNMLAGSIARTKLASGTADRVLTNNGAGAYAEVAQLTPKLGGTGIDNSGATGFLTYNSGTASVGVITDSKVVPISLETGFLGDYKVLFPFACTITGVYGSVSKAVAATDDATITIKNNSGTTMTGGVLTFPASSAKGTAVTGAISANNVISAGQVVTITGAKITAGGEILTVLTYTRTA